MRNKIDRAIAELDAAFDENPDHFHSGVISSLGILFVKACKKSKPEHWFLYKQLSEDLQDIAHEATVQMRDRQA